MNSNYNLKAVLKETGIKADVLRAWERRYGLPIPDRSSGGHRLYSDHDIQVIKWLLARQKDGFSISNAVEMWKKKSEKGDDSTVESSVQMGTESHHDQPVMHAGLSTVEFAGIDDLRSEWINACINFREQLSDNVLNQAFAIYPIEAVCTEVIQRGISEIGTLWYENRINIHQEHFASALATRRLETLIFSCPAPTRNETIIIGCPAGEWHTITQLLMALLLRRRGFNVVYLGANVPSQQFINTLQIVKANIVILAAQQLKTAISLQQSAKMITEYGVNVAFGGRIFGLHPDLPEKIQGYFLGNSLNSAIEIIENIAVTNYKPFKAFDNSEEYKNTIYIYSKHRPFIEAILDQRLADNETNKNMFPDAHVYFGDNIVAALTLGDIEYMNPEMDWLKTLLLLNQKQGHLVTQYLKMYSEVIDQHLGNRAIPISRWLERQVRGISVDANHLSTQ
ncbi:MAG: MerR family transcriptional regulator [Chloroflexota bacterium]